MAKNPYAERRDYGLIGPAFLGLLALVLAAVVAFALLRPTESAADADHSDKLSAQMDAAEGRDQVRQADLAKERNAGL